MKNLPYLEPKIVEELKKKFPPIEFEPSLFNSNEEYLSNSIFRSGQRDVITRLEQIVEYQNKKGR